MNCIQKHNELKLEILRLTAEMHDLTDEIEKEIFQNSISKSQMLDKLHSLELSNVKYVIFNKFREKGIIE